MTQFISAISLIVPDYDQAIAFYVGLMERAGIDIIEEPRVESYGKVVVFRDPFGNKWDLIERH